MSKRVSSTCSEEFFVACKSTRREMAENLKDVIWGLLATLRVS
ncbi:hypothetical protein HMPREF9948_2278 [Propionibacterium sp. 434-HC2]|nr:hypothetical protein HMPREF9948_2278 [Propionibacterium sp. 434-HC2]